MKACVAGINGVNRNDGVYIMLKAHKRLHLYFFPSKFNTTTFRLAIDLLDLGLRGVCSDGMIWEGTGGSIHDGIRLVNAYFLTTWAFALC